MKNEDDLTLAVLGAGAAIVIGIIGMNINQNKQANTGAISGPKPCGCNKGH